MGIIPSTIKRNIETLLTKYLWEPKMYLGIIIPLF